MFTTHHNNSTLYLYTHIAEQSTVMQSLKSYKRILEFSHITPAAYLFKFSSLSEHEHLSQSAPLISRFLFIINVYSHNGFYLP